MDTSTPQSTKNEDTDSLKLSARRLKKRELDRKAQRLARERTKNRIQELELLVEQLKADSTNPEVSNLTATLTRVTEQRNALQNVIKSIDQAIQSYALQHSPAVLRPENARQRLTNNSGSPPEVVSKVEGTNGESSTSVAGANGHSASASDAWQILPLEHLPPPTYPHAGVHPAPDGHLPPAAGWHNSAASPPQHHSSCSSSSEDIIVPSPEWPCDCVLGGPKNYWRTANAALGKSTILSPAQLAIEDFTSEDTPIRVILDGWDSVVKSGKMSLSWKKLREIDEVCFSTCGDVERLGILRTMHQLLVYHGDPTQERCEKVPRWLWTRPSQALPHSYAIDFFVWPGIRERFVFAQHQYCTNTFWQLFRQNLRVTWALDFQDCYRVDADTGRYMFSRAFDDRIRDINSWRMGSDFFMQFPELAGDIPIAGSIAPKVPWSREEWNRYHAIAEHEHPATKGAAEGAMRTDEASNGMSPRSEYRHGDPSEPPDPSCAWPSV